MAKSRTKTEDSDDKKTGTSKGGSSKAGTGTGKTGAGKAETAKTGKTGSSKTGSSKAGTSKAETAKTGSAKTAKGAKAAKSGGSDSSAATKSSAGKAGGSKSAGATQKGATQKGATQKGASPAKRDRREELVAELNELIANLDEHMLAILKQQAEIITYSQKRTEVIRKVSEFQTAIAKGQLPEEGYDPNAAWVEQTEAGFFMICVGRDRIFFNRDELRELTRICWGASDDSQAASRMFRWFERERRDFLNDTGIGRPNSAALRNLYSHIISNYKVKE